MRGLLVKDFRLLRQRARFFVVLLIVALLVGTARHDSTFVVSYLTLVMGIFAASSISYDEYDNCYCFLLTLPIDRRAYTREKYLFGILLGVSAWLVGIAIHCGAVVYHGQQANLASNLLEALLYIPMFLLLNSLIFPFQLKYGAERGRMALLVAVGIFVVALLAVNRMARAAGLPIGELASYLSGMGTQEVLLGSFLIAAAATGASYRISLGIMEKKEL